MPAHNGHSNRCSSHLSLRKRRACIVQNRMQSNFRSEQRKRRSTHQHSAQALCAHRADISPRFFSLQMLHVTVSCPIIECCALAVNAVPALTACRSNTSYSTTPCVAGLLVSAPTVGTAVVAAAAAAAAPDTVRSRPKVRPRLDTTARPPVRASKTSVRGLRFAATGRIVFADALGITIATTEVAGLASSRVRQRRCFTSSAKALRSLCSSHTPQLNDQAIDHYLGARLAAAFTRARGNTYVAASAFTCPTKLTKPSISRSRCIASE
eukprot:SAG11_NODE_9405_length_915_cov_1.323529_1_plen_266_part_01